jgi:hypothetical protein
MRIFTAPALLGLLALVAPVFAQDGGDANALFQTAQNAFNAANNKSGTTWDDARVAIQAVIDADPKHFEAHWLMANAYEREANKGQSHDWFVKCSDLDPVHFLAAWNATTGYSRYQQWDKSLAFLERAEAALAKGERGMPDSGTREEFLKVVEFAIPAGRANLYWELGRKDDAYKIAAERITDTPFYPAMGWYLGQQAEAEGSNAKAIEYYKLVFRQWEEKILPKFKAEATDKDKAEEDCKKWWNGLVSATNRHFGLDDRSTDSPKRHDYLKRYERWIEMQRPKYGSVDDHPRAHQRFTDSEFELTIDLPHPKLMRLKKDTRYPWVFWFEIEHPPVQPGKINTHVVDVAWHQADLQDVDVMVRINASGFGTSMNLQSGGAVKWVEPENLAEGLLADATRIHYVEVASVKKPRKARFGRYQGFETSFEGKEAKAVENYESAVAQKTKDPKPPPVWEIHQYVTKGKKHTWTIEFKCLKGQWKERQKDIQLLLKHIVFPG